MKRGMDISEYAIGVDVGGTKVNVCAFKLSGKSKITSYQIVKQSKAVYDEKSSVADIIVNLIGDVVAACPGRPDSINLCVPGIVKNNQIVYLPHLSELTDADIAARLRKKFHAVVTIVNDADAFTYGEYLFGAAKGHTDVVGITLGTGMGGGIIVNNKLLSGKGEIGHVLFQQAGYSTAGGVPGIIENYVNGASITRRYHAITGEIKTAQEILYENSMAAKRTIDETASYLGYAIASVINILGPSAIVFGGSLSKCKPLLLEAWTFAKQCVMHPSLYETVAFKESSLGDIAAPIGACALAKQAKTGHKV